MQYFFLKSRCETPSDNLVTQAVRESIAEVLDFQAGQGTGRKTCLGGGLDIMHYLQLFLNPVGKNLSDWGVPPEKAEEVEKFAESLVQK